MSLHVKGGIWIIITLPFSKYIFVCERRLYTTCDELSEYNDTALSLRWKICVHANNDGPKDKRLMLGL